MELDNLFNPALVAAQQPKWPQDELAGAVKELKSFPPLVFAGECDDLKLQIAQAAEGRAFWLQGGDCAETFAAATADSIRDRIKTILQILLILSQTKEMPVLPRKRGMDLPSFWLKLA